MVCELIFGLSGPGSYHGLGHCVVFLGKKLTLTVPYAEGGPAIDYHQGGVETLQFYRLMLRKPG